MICVHRINTEGLFLHTLSQHRYTIKGQGSNLKCKLSFGCIESMQTDFLVYMESIQRDSLLFIENPYTTARQKTKASNMEGKASFIYVEPILRRYTKEKSLQALFRISREAIHKRNASNLEGKLSFRTQRTNTEWIFENIKNPYRKARQRQRPPIWMAGFLYTQNQYR